MSNVCAVICNGWERCWLNVMRCDVSQANWRCHLARSSCACKINASLGWNTVSKHVVAVAKCRYLLREGWGSECEKYYMRFQYKCYSNRSSICLMCEDVCGDEQQLHANHAFAFVQRNKIHTFDSPRLAYQYQCRDFLIKNLQNKLQCKQKVKLKLNWSDRDWLDAVCCK